MVDRSPSESREPARPRVLERAVVRFAGDSGDGVQLTGSQFTATTARFGNDLATLPDYPAEIRAPAGTLPGVSGFQIQFSSGVVFTPGDLPDVLVAMNPAALRANLAELKIGGFLIVDDDSFGAKDLAKAGYATSPIDDGTLDGYRLVRLGLTRLTRTAVDGLGLDTRAADRCRNFFALGMMYWLFQRPLEPTAEWIREKFAASPQLVEANRRALQAGYTCGEATEVFTESFTVPPAPAPVGLYRNISGNTALALGLLAAAERSGLQLFLGSYPITPASDILHDLARHRNFGVITFQAEDEIAAVCAAIGASFAGALGCTSTSGPGMALKSEALGLAVMAELPLVVCDIQRSGPSTGMPTKTEQADLWQALFGRPSEAPLPVLAASSPAGCFDAAYEASRIAIRYMTPVVLLSDGYLGNGVEPWRVPDPAELPPILFRTAQPGDFSEGFAPYRREPDTLARPWAIPGTPGLEHRIGGLEKWDGTGGVSYDPQNHERMVHLRAEKVARIARELPPVSVDGDERGRLLVLGWGSTEGAISGAVRSARERGLVVSHLHLRWLCPFPADLGEVLGRFERVLVPELNLGQLALLLQGRFLRPIESFGKVQGRPFTEAEILQKIEEQLA